MTNFRSMAAPATALFLANNVTLDLNGYTVTFAEAKYEHVPNYGFEEVHGQQRRVQRQPV